MIFVELHPEGISMLYPLVRWGSWCFRQKQNTDQATNAKRGLHGEIVFLRREEATGRADESDRGDHVARARFRGDVAAGEVGHRVFGRRSWGLKQMDIFLLRRKLDLVKKYVGGIFQKRLNAANIFFIDNDF